jgi:hypothetical protein
MALIALSARCCGDSFNFIAYQIINKLFIATKGIITMKINLLMSIWAQNPTSTQQLIE